jgi:preprotein translocase subunit SecE
MLGVRVPPGLPNLSMNPADKIKELSLTSKQFYLDVRGEMRKVSWPSRDEVFGTTMIVIVSVFFFGAYLGLVDTVLSYGFQKVLQYFTGAGG